MILIFAAPLRDQPLSGVRASHPRLRKVFAIGAESSEPRSKNNRPPLEAQGVYDVVGGDKTETTAVLQLASCSVGLARVGGCDKARTCTRVGIRTVRRLAVEEYWSFRQIEAAKLDLLVAVVVLVRLEKQLATRIIVLTEGKCNRRPYIIRVVV